MCIRDSILCVHTQLAAKVNLCHDAGSRARAYTHAVRNPCNYSKMCHLAGNREATRYCFVHILFEHVFYVCVVFTLFVYRSNADVFTCDIENNYIFKNRQYFIKAETEA